MSYFDLLINFIEASMYFIFLYYIFDRKKSIFTLFVFIALKFISTTIHNYYLLPEILNLIISNIILLLYACYLNRNMMENLFFTLLIHLINNISTTISMVATNIFFGFPFYSGNAYVFIAILAKALDIMIFIGIYYLLKRYQILPKKTKKLFYIFSVILILDLLYGHCIDYVFYENTFNKYHIIIFILLNVLTIFICFIFFETQKEQRKLLTLQRNELLRESQDKINQLNQKNVLKLNVWKHDMTYVFSYLAKYIKNEDYDSAISTIDLYNQVINGYNLFEDTNDNILNTLIVENSQKLIDKDIQIYTHNSYKNIPIEDKDYQDILSEFMKYAIEECGSSSQNEIHISISNQEPLFIMELKYTSESHLFDNYIIEDIVDKYNGHITISYENEFIIINIVL